MSRQLTETCDPRTSVTRSLLGYGIIAGPVYVVVSLAQALTREGFDLTRHAWSLLANGDLGWIHITNFMVAAAATLAAAVGLGRAMTSGRGATWAPRLIGVFGVSLIAGGIFRADPGMGFPAGTPEGPGVVTPQGMLHFAAGAVGFLAVSMACLVVARRFAGEGRRGWAVYSGVTGAFFLLSFAAVATGGGAVWANLTFVAGIMAIWTWLSALSLHLYRRATPQRA
ncbi:DUF998 domain-containing protein [Nonomuraea sp. NPDC048916]|uniref:DUF998 domain-containing protein n=1 Tax=Nonomuraea sp. NPDC048916 TaxID=3154232 RepID=UPI0033C013D2